MLSVKSRKVKDCYNARYPSTSPKINIDGAGSDLANKKAKIPRLVISHQKTLSK
jgi:hypothetical protein